MSSLSTFPLPRSAEAPPKGSPRWVKYTRWIGDQSQPFDRITDVVIVPPNGVLESGVRKARALLSKNAVVALVGHGALLLDPVTLGATAHGSVCLMELGGFARDQVASTAAMRADARTWLSEIFKDLPIEALEEVLYGSAAQRFLQEWFNAAQFGEELKRFCAGRRVHTTDLGWAGNSLILGSRAQRASRWTFWPYMAGGLCMTLASSGKSMLLRKSTLLSLAKLQRTRQGEPPQQWLVLQNEWYRFNRHLIDSIARPMIAKGERLGILLSGDLREGSRNEVDLKVRGRGDFFSGLGPLREHLDLIWLDQVAGPESWSAWWKLSKDATRSSLTAAVRATLQSSQAPASFDPFTRPKSLAQLLTIDVSRAAAAAHAAKRASERSMPKRAEVYSSTSALAAAAAADHRLRRCGHTTVEFFHGAGAEEWPGMQECHSSLRAVWTEVDAETLRRLGQHAVAAGMPNCEQDHPARSGGPWRVLLLSNYVHRDLGTGGHFSFEPFLKELLRTSQYLEQIAPGNFVFRWRPHPADNPAALRRVAAEIPGLARSTGSLAEDFAWADCVLSSMSTAVVEATLVGVPIFLHVPPQYEEAPNAAAIAIERRFFLASDGAARIAATFRTGQPVDITPERSAQALYFGPSRRPRPLSEALHVGGF